MLVAVSLRYPVVFVYICINIDLTIFFSKNKWQNLLSYTWKHKNRHIIYVSSVCSCKIIGKNVFFIYVGGHLVFRHFGPFSQNIKKCNPFFSWSSWYFESESSEKSILTDKTHESVICDIWAYTTQSLSLQTKAIVALITTVYDDSP